MCGREPGERSTGEVETHTYTNSGYLGNTLAFMSIQAFLAGLASAQGYFAASVSIPSRLDLRLYIVCTLRFSHI